MKKITAYVNTIRVHWLVEELEAIGIKEIMVTEYFSPSSQISRMELYARDEDVETARGIVHRLGTLGSVGDHAFLVEEYDPKLPGQIFLGKRTSKLEESRAKQLINFMLRGTHRKITTAFLVITLCVVVVGAFILVRTSTFRKSVEHTIEETLRISETVGKVESALLEEMLAAERLHRGETSAALRDFYSAQTSLQNAMSSLEKKGGSNNLRTDSLAGLEHEFHRVAGGMFEIVDSLSRYGDVRHHLKVLELSREHTRIMARLDGLRLQLLGVLRSLDDDARGLVMERQKEVDGLIREVMVSILLLSVAAMGMTIMIWVLVERTVARPIQRLMDEASIVDSGELK